MPGYDARAQPSKRRRLTAAITSTDRRAHERPRGSRRRYGLPETSSQLVGVVIDRCSVGDNPIGVAVYHACSECA